MPSHVITLHPHHPIMRKSAGETLELDEVFETLKANPRYLEMVKHGASIRKIKEELVDTKNMSMSKSTLRRRMKEDDKTTAVWDRSIDVGDRRVGRKWKKVKMADNSHITSLSEQQIDSVYETPGLRHTEEAIVSSDAVVFALRPNSAGVTRKVSLISSSRTLLRIAHSLITKFGMLVLAQALL